MMKLAALSVVALGLLAPSLQAQSLAELEESIKKERDDVDPAIILQVAELETRESMEALLRAFDTFASPFMRREVLVQLKRYDDHEDSFQPALEKLMDVATGSKVRELRVAALEALGYCTQNGQVFLGLIVESPADDEIRERAMELHVRIGGDAYADWYKKIYQRRMRDVQSEIRDKVDEQKKKNKKRRKKKDDEPAPKEEIVWPTSKLRATAMSAVLESMTDDELIAAVEKERNMEIRRTALRELAARDHKKAPQYAKEILGRPDFNGTDRALAAEILLEDQGPEVAEELIDVALKGATQEVVRQRIADMLSELDDEDVNKDLLKLVGKGKEAQKVFAIRATKHITDDEKLTKKIRKGLKDKKTAVAVASIEALAARRDRESVEDMEKLLEKTKDEHVRAALLRALSTIYDGENEWVERLMEFANHEDLDMRNSALREIARLGRRNTVSIFEAKLTDQNWSTRLIALHALEEQRDEKFLQPIVDQMQKETGRMLIEFADSLFRLTGKSFGNRASAWKSWMAKGEDIAVVGADEVERLQEEAERRRLMQISSAQFFGIQIDSHRVIFIIDVSGSMMEPVRAQYIGELGRPRIDVAKEELLRAIEALDANALFNIVPFSGGVESWLEEGVVGVDDYSREDAMLYVERLGAAGGTNLFGALEFAFEDEDVDTIFVLSDGEPSVGDIIDPQLIRDEIAEMNETRDIVINTIAIGADLQVLEWLAEDSGGTHVAID